MRPILHVDKRVFHDPRLSGIQHPRFAITDQLRPTGDGRIEALMDAIIQRQHVVLDRFLHEEILKVLELVRVPSSYVVGLAEVLSHVV